MPLPPALAARLAKRGIINLPKEPEVADVAPTDEEIIAEDYDEVPHGDGHSINSDESFDMYQGYVGCPNKWNVFHDCSAACRERWKEAKPLDSKYERKRAKLLKQYPLPMHWIEVLDPGIGRYYYWNTKTDLVSWLPPGHPKCQVSRSAATLRKEMTLDKKKRVKDDTKEIERKATVERPSRSRRGSLDDDDRSENSEDERENRERRESRRERRRDKERSSRDKRSKRSKVDSELDPMDPASYGECPRGTWSSGLPRKDEARTGVDTTANGPLYQMRPYPSPGAVLRANAEVSDSIGPKKLQ